MGTIPQNPTILDVAKRAGVSRSTSSRVLSGKGYVAVETRERVLRAADEISYSANYFARGLRGSGLGMIGLINRDYLHPFFSMIAQGLEQEAKAENIGVVTVCSEADAKIERQAIDILLERSVWELVFATPVSKSNIRYAQKKGAHCVVIERDLGYSSVDRIMNNNFEAGAMVGRTLVERGYTDFGFLGMDESLGVVERERRVGYLKAIRESGNEIHPAVDYQVRESYSIEHGYKALAAMCADHGPPRALMVGSDFLLVGALRYAYDHGIRIPDDMAVVSADNLYTRIVTPEIDSIDYSISEMGRQAVRLCRSEPKAQRVYRTVTIAPRYISRGST